MDIYLFSLLVILGSMTYMVYTMYKSKNKDVVS